MTIAQLRQQKGLLIDTNLMLLYCVGRYDPYMIPKLTERLSRYSVDDYKLLVQFIELFKKVVTIPNVLTETVNLIDKRSGRFTGVLRQFANDLILFEELYVSTEHVVGQHPRHFLTFGITDLALFELAKQSYLVLTDDSATWSLIAGNDGSALNFDQLRALLLQKGPPGKRR